MAINIRDLVSDYFSPSVVANHSEKFQESERAIAKTLEAFSAVIMQGLYVKGDFVPNLFNQTKKLYRNAILSGLSSSGGVANSKVVEILNFIFGERQKNILKEIALSSKIKESSVQPLYNLAANVVFGVVGKYFQENQATDAWLTHLFLGQQKWAQKLLPSDLDWNQLSLGKDFEAEIKALPLQTEKQIKRLNYQNA